MKTANLRPQQQTFRFRKWSRKRWAIFHSLGKEVTIGQLIVPANNQALKKQGTNTAPSFSFSLQTASEAAPPIVSQDLLLALLICLEMLLLGKMSETIPVDSSLKQIHSFLQPILCNFASMLIHRIFYLPLNYV